MVMAEPFKGRGLLRASVLVPWSIPTAVTAKLWYFIFAFDGIANALLGTEILWTGSEWPARFAVIIADVWKTTPFIALLILAGLQMIPEDVYEAAKMDGATEWQRFTQITLPLVKPALLVAVLFRVLDVLRIFDLPYILTGGANNTTTLSILVVNQIRQGFNSRGGLLDHHLPVHLPGRLRLREGPGGERGPDPAVAAEGGALRWHRQPRSNPTARPRPRRRPGAGGASPGGRCAATSASP